MTFEEFYTGWITAASLPDSAANRSLMEAAWDAALCSASAACLERGKLREPVQIHSSISQLHTWNSQPIS